MNMASKIAAAALALALAAWLAPVSHSDATSLAARPAVERALAE